MLNSTQSLKTIFDQALMTAAAYADLRGVTFPETSDSYVSQLKKAFGSAAVASFFATRFGVVNHQANTSSGFSATLFRARNVDPNDPSRGYTLAIRGTEFDTPADLYLADGEIALAGVA